MQLPTVAVESYCPIVDPISGRTAGQLAVLLALGSPEQVCAPIGEVVLCS